MLSSPRGLHLLLMYWSYCLVAATVCNPGDYGPACNQSCPINCQSQICNQTGHCNSCTTGWHGDQCYEACSLHCNDQTCDQASAECLRGCVSGYTGKFCETATVCNPGDYSPACNQSCPINCQSQICNQTGHCNSCTTGWHGDHCYGACPLYCEGRTCDQTSAECLRGCVSGYTGRFCESGKPELEVMTATEPGALRSGLLYLAIICLVSIILYVVGFVALWFTRRRAPAPSLQEPEEIDRFNAIQKKEEDFPPNFSRGPTLTSSSTSSSYSSDSSSSPRLTSDEKKEAIAKELRERDYAPTE